LLFAFWLFWELAEDELGWELALVMVGDSAGLVAALPLSVVVPAPVVEVEALAVMVLPVVPMLLPELAV
jgi:hypothetical protein